MVSLLVNASVSPVVNISPDLYRPAILHLLTPPKALPCQITFFPFPGDDPDCVSWSHAYKTETRLFHELDELEGLVEGVRPVLHHFRGAYSSGGHPDWPQHAGGS